jgi:hypothetical protein
MSGSLGTFAGFQPTVTREGPIYNVDVDEAESGIEVRTVWGTSPRYRYQVEIVLMNTTEVGTLDTLVKNNYGEGGNFTITDPIVGGTVTVRMEGNLSLAQYEGFSTWWMARMTFISVLS